MAAKPPSNYRERYKGEADRPALASLNEILTGAPPIQLTIVLRPTPGLKHEPGTKLKRGRRYQLGQAVVEVLQAAVTGAEQLQVAPHHAAGQGVQTFGYLPQGERTKVISA